jgi:hypothetical protein
LSHLYGLPSGRQQLAVQLFGLLARSRLRGLRPLRCIGCALLCDGGANLGFVPRSRLGLPSLALPRSALVGLRSATFGILRTMPEIGYEPFERGEHRTNRRRSHAAIGHAGRHWALIRAVRRSR